MSITVEEVESEMGAGAYRDDDGNVSIDLETFTAWWKAHESDPRGEQLGTSRKRLCTCRTMGPGSLVCDLKRSPNAPTMMATNRSLVPDRPPPTPPPPRTNVL